MSDTGFVTDADPKLALEVDTEDLKVVMARMEKAEAKLARLLSALRVQAKAVARQKVYNSEVTAARCALEVVVAEVES